MYANANFAAASNCRRSMSGVATLSGDTAIGWESSKHTFVITATYEAGYVALCDTSKENLFTRAILVSLQPELRHASRCFWR